MIRHSLVPPGALLLLACGCAADGSSAQSYSKRRIEAFAYREVYDAAEATMREYFRIAQADSRSGVIRSVPVEERTSEVTGPLGQTLSTPRPQRRIAEMRLESQGDAVLLRCGVILQRPERVDHVGYAHRHSSEDTPNQTPLKESQGLDIERDAVWSTTGYDRRLENEMLAAVAERLAIELP